MSLRKKFPILKRTKFQLLINVLLNWSVSYSVAADKSYFYKNFFGEEIYFPGKAHFKLFNLFYFGYLSHLADKYMYDAAAEKVIRPQLFIDCGAFVGGSSLAAKRFFPSLKEIWAIEPTPSTYMCLKKNLKDAVFQSLNVALGESECTSKLYLSETHTDNSLSPMTENMTGEEALVRIKTLSTLLKRTKYSDDQIILKLEAEGFEHEVLLGMGERKPKIILIDISPEREGASVVPKLEDFLKDDYNFHFTSKVLMATRKDR